MTLWDLRQAIESRTDVRWLLATLIAPPIVYLITRRSERRELEHFKALRAEAERPDPGPTGSYGTKRSGL